MVSKQFDRSAEPFLESLDARRRDALNGLQAAEEAGRRSEAAAYRKAVASFEKMIRQKGGVVEDAS